MPVPTHCLPSGSLATGQAPVPNFPGPASIFTPAGSKRGVVVLLHGLFFGAGFPNPCVDVGGILPSLQATLAADLQADGWVVIWPTLVGDAAGLGQGGSWSAEFANDTGKGSRLANSIASLWWAGHVIPYLHKNYPGFPIVPMGFSGGGYHSALIAKTQTSTIAGFAAFNPAIQPWAVANLGINWDLAPVLSFTLASGENGLTLPQSTLTVNETISVQNPPQTGGLLVASSGAILQIIRYTSWSGSVFSGVTGGDSSHTMATNGAVIQSTYTSGADIGMTDLNAMPNGSQGTIPIGMFRWQTGDPFVGYAHIKTLSDNASGAGMPVTGLARSGGTHQMDATDVTAIMGWVSGTLDTACPAVH